MKLLDLIPEALGVPKDLLKVNKEIYDKLISKLEKDKELELDSDDPVSIINYLIDGPFKIDDFLFKNIYITISLTKRKYSGKLKFVGAVVHSPQGTDKGFNRMSRTPGEYTTNIAIKFNMPDTYTTIKPILDDLKNNTDIMSTLAHELKHDFDKFKNKKGKRTKDITKYQAILMTQIGIPALDRFFYNLYLTTFTETLVFPTEFAAKLQYDGVTKKDFLKIIKEDKLYKKLSEAKEMTYEKIYSKVKKYVEMSDDFSFLIVDEESKERVADYVIDKAYIKYSVNVSDYLGMISDNIQRLNLMGFVDNEDLNDSLTKSIPKIERSLFKYKDAESFLKAEVKTINRNADVALRKLAKVYALLPDEPDKKSVFNKADTFKEKRKELLSKKQPVK